MDITKLWTENKKYVLIGVGLLIAGGFILWFRNYETQQQSNEANAEAESEAEDAQLAQELLAAQYSTGADSSPVATTGPTVDTGNDTLQQLINSVLNPTSTNETSEPATSTSQTNNIASGNPAPTTLPPGNVNPEPVLSAPGVNNSNNGIGINHLKTAPILYTMPTSTVQ